MKITFLSTVRIAIAMSLITAPTVRGQDGQQSGTTKSAAQGSPARTLAEGQSATLGFSVVLLLGDTQASKVAEDTVPAAARKALADLKDFLPYKSYRLLDTQFSACCGTAIMSRLRGPDDQDYDLELNPRSLLGGKWSVRFALREPASSAAAGDISVALREKELVAMAAQRRELERKLSDLRQQFGEGYPVVAQTKRQIQEIERQTLEETNRKLPAGNAARVVIDASFNMDVGETVVVGTSRLKGDKALIALLTAIARK